MSEVEESLVERGTELIGLIELHAKYENIVAPAELLVCILCIIIYLVCMLKNDFNTMPGRLFRWVLGMDLIFSIIIGPLRWWDKTSKTYELFAYPGDEDSCHFVVLIDSFLHVGTFFINTVIVYAMFYNIYWGQQFSKNAREKMGIWCLIMFWSISVLVAIFSSTGEVDNKIGWCIGSSTAMVFKQFTWFILLIIQVILVIPTTLMIWGGARLIKKDPKSQRANAKKSETNYKAGAYIRYYGIIIAQSVGIMPILFVEYMALARKPISRNIMVFMVYGIPVGHLIRVFIVVTKFLPNFMEKLGNGICKSVFIRYQCCKGYTAEGAKLEEQEAKEKANMQKQSNGNMFDRLPFWMQLAMTLLVPFCLLVGVAIIMIEDISTVRTKASNIESDIDLTVFISDYIHETQKERGATGVFMGAQGTRFRDELAAQTIDTDIYKARLSNFLDTSFTNVRLVSKSIFIQSLMAMLQLNEHREDVQAFSISKGQGIGFYTNMNMNFLGIVGLVARDANLGDIQQLMYSFLAYTHSKEKAGNERALGSTPFAKNEWNPSSYSKFVKVIAMQDTHDYFFETFSDPVNIKFRDDTMLQDKCVQVHQRMRQLALDNLDASVYAEYEGSMWFWNMTCKINLQRIVESHIAEELQTEAQNIVDSSTSGMIIVIVTLGAVLIMDGLTVMALAQAQATSQLEEFRQSLRSTDPEAVEEARVKTIEKFKKKLKTMNLVKNKRQRNQCGRYLRTIMIAIESMKNIKFLTQVYLSVFLSAVSLVVFSWLLLEDTIVHSRRAAQLWENMNLSFFLSNVVHETQKERGATGVHMNSAGVSFEKELPEQRLLTNVHARFLYQFLKNDFIDYMEIQNFQSVRNVMDGLAIINEHRLKVWNKEYTPPVGIGWYTSFNMKIISVMDDIAKDASGDNIEPRVLSYLGFMYAKEKAGNERAVGTLGLSAGMWPTVGDLATFTRIVNFQLAGMNYFNVFSNPESKRRYKILLDIDPSEVKNPVVIANAYQQAMLDHNTTLMEMWNAEDWFNNITLKINRLRVVEQTIAEDMREFFSRFNLDYWKKIVIVLAVIISMSLVTLSIMLKGFALVMRSNAFYSYKGRLERQLLKEEKKIKAQLEQGSDDSDDSEVDVADVKLN